jgi:hypothetical protein
LKIFWSINVYSRGELLKLQQDLIREHFGDRVFIYVYCNSDSDFRHKEDLYYQTDVNSGHHNGVRDSYNETVKHLDGYDVLISTHADCIFTDYSVVDWILNIFEQKGFDFASLVGRTGINPHRPGLGRINRAHVDFFLCRPELFKKIFPTSYDMDAWEGIECFLGRNVREKKEGLSWIENWMVIPAVEHFDNQEERPDVYVQRPYRFDDVVYRGVSMLRDNDFIPTRENYERFKSSLKSPHPVSSSQL